MTYYVLHTLFLISSIISYIIFRRQRFKSRGPLTCRTPPHVPHIAAFLGLDGFWKTLKLKQRRQSLKALADLYKTHGNTFTVTLLGGKVIHTAHPENLKAVFGTRWKHWGTGRLKAMEPFSGRGFVTTDGEEWRAYRSLLAPALSESINVDLKSLNTAFDEFLGNIPENCSVDLAPVFEEMFLDLSFQFVFGRKLSALRSDPSPVDMSTFQKAFERAQFWMGLRLMLGTIGRAFCGKGWKQSCDTVHVFIDYYVNLALEEVSCGALHKRMESRGELPINEASLIYNLAVQKKSAIEIRSQIIPAMMVTQDTTGIVLSNTVFLLSRAPEVWNRLREEISGLGPHEKWTTQGLKSCKLLQNILKESLRLHPLFSSNSRVSAVDTILPTGGGHDGCSPIFVPVGSKIITSFYTLHRQPSVFGKDVETFNPDRWDHISPDSWEFMPFSHGPRSCAGRYKALTEASYIIGRLADKYARIESQDDQPWTEDVKLVVKNFNGCKVSLYAHEKKETLTC